MAPSVTTGFHTWGIYFVGGGGIHDVWSLFGELWKWEHWPNRILLGCMMIRLRSESCWMSFHLIPKQGVFLRSSIRIILNVNIDSYSCITQKDSKSSCFKNFLKFDLFWKKYSGIGTHVSLGIATSGILYVRISNKIKFKFVQNYLSLFTYVGIDTKTF